MLSFDHAHIEWLEVGGRDGFVLVPKHDVDPCRRWVWAAPAWLCILKDQQNPLNTMVEYQFYVDELTRAGVHVVGVDAGTTLGSPRGAEYFGKVYDFVVERYNLHCKARLIGQSNGGLTVYGWAFRDPGKVDRILGIYPALDLRSWPGLHKVVGPESIGDPVYGHVGLTREELELRLSELNPIDNLAPLASSGVAILHIHGDTDRTVPYEPNTAEAERRYHGFNGRFRSVVLNGMGHSPGPGFYDSRLAADFLLEGTEPGTRRWSGSMC